MATLTGRNGALLYRSRPVARVRSFAVNLSRDALEETCVGADSRSYVPGLFGATGSAVILIDLDDEAGRELLNSVMPDKSSAKQDIQFVFDQATGRSINAAGFLTSVGASVAVGDVQSADVQFQLTGPVSGGF